jgi:hypothetical protein
VERSLAVLTFFCLAAGGWGQEASRAAPDAPVIPAETASSTSPQAPNKHERKHIFWVIPDYRSSPALATYKPLRVGEKFAMAWQGVLDPGTFFLAGAFAGKDQISHTDPSFGEGAKGYADRFAANYGDLVIGDFMTEAVFPAVLHEDPRYFRRGSGSTWARLGSAVGQIFWTHRDSGGRIFNFSEIGGNAAAVAISNAYHPDARDATDNAERLGIQVGLDMAGNIMKEFWPDIHHMLTGKHSVANP